MGYRVYLVGGAVRDELLGMQPRENDWVVVGARPGDLLEKGYRQVGASFPVFLHPETAEEYALARKERKRGHGYHGFEVEFDPGVTLDEDLQRRDLTINALAFRPATGDQQPICNTSLMRSSLLGARISPPAGTVRSRL